MAEASGGVKRGDTFPFLKATLKTYNSSTEKYEPLDLTNATSITMYLRSTNAPGTVVSGTCVFTKNASGAVEYEWGASDTALADLYEGEFKVLWSNGKTQTVPGTGYFTYQIEPNLAVNE